MPLGEAVVGGLSSNDAAMAGPWVPEATGLRATVEIFAADPSWTRDDPPEGPTFERLEAYVLFGPRP